MTSLLNKLSLVSADVANLRKDGLNDHHKFKFVSHDAVVRAVSRSLRQNGVAFNCECVDFKSEPSGAKDKSGRPECIDTVSCVFTFSCLETGESSSHKWVGKGIDNQDKGTYKALTQAKKTFLICFFLIATGDQVADADYGHGKKSEAPRAKGSFPAPNLERENAYKSMLAAIVPVEPGKSGSVNWESVSRTIEDLPNFPQIDPSNPSFKNWTIPQMDDLRKYHEHLASHDN